MATETLHDAAANRLQKRAERLKLQMGEMKQEHTTIMDELKVKEELIEEHVEKPPHQARSRIEGTMIPAWVSYAINIDMNYGTISKWIEQDARFQQVPATARQAFASLL